jgi:ClpX C4-type zinc finger
MGYLEMSNDLSADKALGIAWGHFMRNGMFDEAFLTASLARRAAAKWLQPNVKDPTEGMMEKTAEELLHRTVQRQAHPPRECSFCGKKEPEVTLGAGPNAYICNECVAKFNSVLETPA